MLARLFTDWLKRRGSWRMIQREGDDYLERFFIARITDRNIYLHRVWKNDPDDPHNHPWWSVSIILKGGYKEYFLGGGEPFWRKAGTVIVRDPFSFHRLMQYETQKPGETWSLFITGKRKNSWGFMTKDGFQTADEYVKEDVAVYGRDFILEGYIFPRVKWLTDRR